MLVYGELSRHVAIALVDGVSHASKPRPAAGAAGAALITGAAIALGSEPSTTDGSCCHPDHELSNRRV